MPASHWLVHHFKCDFYKAVYLTKQHHAFVLWSKEINTTACNTPWHFCLLRKRWHLRNYGEDGIRHKTLRPIFLSHPNLYVFPTTCGKNPTLWNLNSRTNIFKLLHKITAGLCTYALKRQLISCLDLGSHFRDSSLCILKSSKIWNTSIPKYCSRRRVMEPCSLWFQWGSESSRRIDKTLLDRFIIASRGEKDARKGCPKLLSSWIIQDAPPLLRGNGYT